MSAMNGTITFEDELRRSGRLVYTNVGVSMMPLLREGRDVMVIERLDDEPRRYDAVLFRRDGVRGRGEYVMHRILRKLPDDKYWIVGDNCTDGETVSRENILGRLTHVNRGGRIIKTTDLSYRMYVAFWCAPYHLRFAVLKLRIFCSRAIAWLKHRLSR